ncbi:MAG: Gfo/Idh/MocA family oxidoreductase [Planctomycetaceae bacterium]|nr:Gfo/Idh/MocA family oxidoreductase [Planctomycetaceae bacterium]
MTAISHSVRLAPLGIGVVGLGHAGTYHIERIGLRDDCQVVAAFDDCPDAARQAAGLVPRVATSRVELLDDPSIELIVLATPPASHAALAIEALAARKHVLVETPLCLGTVEADAILAAAARADRSVIVAQTRRWENDFYLARQCVERGIFGPLETIKHVSWQYGIPSRRPAGPGPQLAAHRWRDDHSTGGGVLWEFGVHDFDQLLQLAGEPAQSVFVEPCAGSGTAGIMEGFLAVVRFPSGVRAHIEVNRSAPVSMQTGWIVVGRLGTYSAGTQFTVHPDGEVVDVPLPPAFCDPDEFYAAVVRHVREGAPNPIPAGEARQTIAVIEAALSSARCGQAMPVTQT